ncbi:MAG: HDOD domain-containing protein [Planctomycetes bacterium]|nr:HDOD domain-containing protein [Planctomycetota bacterium]
MTVVESSRETVGMPSPELRSQLLNQTAQWQMIPDIAQKALAMARDPNCSIREFSSVIECDAKLATEILRIVNSVIYAARTPILNLKQAVTRLGFAHCRNVILAASLGSSMRRLPVCEAWMQLVLWRHSVLTGMIAIGLNKEFKLGFLGEEFTAGLIHDVGRSLLGIIATDHFDAADPLDFEESGDFLQRERDNLQTDHCELGAWFIAHNKLPEALVDVVRLHHTPAETSAHQRLVATTAVADHMANHIQRNGCADGYIPEENSAMEVLFREDSNHASRYCQLATRIMADAIQEAKSSNSPFGLS